MISTHSLSGSGSASTHTRIAFIQSGWHSELVNACRDGFCAELSSTPLGSIEVHLMEVPGAYEIPLHAKTCADSGIYDAVVAAGLVVDGGIYRHEFVATAVLNGLMQVQLETGVPVLSVVLTPQQFHEHTTHHEFFAQHLALKGQEAAQTCAGIVLQAAELATFLAGRSGV
ncbi:MAG TPA: 6,7-dimethyl-8-ribityllumazine synthase [Acidimicrobiaceae bacterium]|jgi:6,7-dimethyl-8-ribityllumazine synthase|nr:6,7-dimethyl-8-ribityllumazine synthase [Acidimicrobiaceae bacterium]